MAQKQDPPKKLMAPKKEGMPKRRNTLVRIDRVVVKPKPKPKTGLLKKALTQGDQTSASQTFSARAKKGFAMSVGKAFKSDTLKNALAKGDRTSAAETVKAIAAKAIGSKKKVASQDSIPKQTYFSNKPTLSLIEKMGKKPKPDTTAKPIVKTLPYKPKPVAKPKLKGVSLIKLSVGKTKK